jgi:hypothetical protein
VAVFNESDDRRVVAGVARSLGRPDVSVLEPEDRPGIVCIVVAWELFWYRYEVEVATGDVAIAAQGHDPAELSDAERQANATADARGVVTLSG